MGGESTAPGVVDLLDELVVYEAGLELIFGINSCLLKGTPKLCKLWLLGVLPGPTK